MRRQAFWAPVLQFWQETKAKRTGRGSLAAGAVTVRPTRLPWPPASVNRYQYSRAGRRPPTTTRQVQSAADVAVAVATATTSWNCGSAAISTVRRSRLAPPVAGQRVHNTTLSLVGSPDATPSG